MSALKDLPYYSREDYHNFSYRGSDKEWRKRLNIGVIYVNAAICKTCGYFIRSKNRHDMVYCNCTDENTQIAVDGGSWYARRVLGKDAVYTDVIEYYDDVEEST